MYIHLIIVINSHLNTISYIVNKYNYYHHCLIDLILFVPKLRKDFIRDKGHLTHICMKAGKKLDKK